MKPPSEQLDLFADRVNLLPVDEEPKLVELVQPPATGKETQYTFIVWREPQERFNMNLMKGDIELALLFFREQTDKEPKGILLHPKNEKFAEEVPDGIIAEYRHGPLSSEIWIR